MNERVNTRAPLVVVAVGGNSLILDSTRTSIDDQYEAARRTAAHVVDLMQRGYRVVLTHGNGPQVGFILRRSELALGELPAVPMHYAGADIQGAVGFMFVTAIESELAARGLSKPVASLVTRVEVDPEDPAFSHPTKPIGSHMSEERANVLARELGWTVREDAGRGWRRVVASPQPQKIVDLPALSVLADAGYTVVGCGGGGIPVRRTADGSYAGVEAVIDKDLASSLLAQQLGADVLLISTGVPRVALEFNTPNERWLDRMTVAEARRYMSEGHFHDGSMGPKVKAVVEFVEATGCTGVITDPEHMGEALDGTNGTTVVADA